MADTLKSVSYLVGILSLIIVVVVGQNKKLSIRNKYVLPGGRTVHIFDSALEEFQVLQLMNFMISNDNWR